MKNLSSSDFDIDGQPMPSNLQPQHSSPELGEKITSRSGRDGNRGTDVTQWATNLKKNSSPTTRWFGAESPWITAGLSATTGLILGVMLGRKR